MSKILRRGSVFATPWFEVIEKTVAGADQPFYSLKLYQYVTILAITEDGKIPLVRQYRPAIEDYTLELPSGHLEEAEQPSEAALRELAEETGYTASKAHLLGKLVPDTGRLETRLWCFFAQGAKKNRTSFPDAHTNDASPEKGLELMLCSPQEMFEYIRTGRMLHALDLAVISLAILNNRLKVTDAN